MTDARPALAPLVAALAALPRAPRYLAAFSGGPDSTALLVAMRAAALPGELVAVHVHHGWSARADDWAAHCAEVAARLGVALHVSRVDATSGAREHGPEAAARSARYRALAELVGSGEVICTAHHREDQAETVLLQLLRGAGVRGAAGMPALKPCGRGLLARPLLGLSRETLAACVREAGIGCVVDPSNADPALDRAYLRAEVLPAIERRWPAAARTLSRAAAHLAAASELTERLAREDLASLRRPSPDTLEVAGLGALGRERAREVLRAWLRDAGRRPPGTRVLDSILDEVLAARADATPAACWRGGAVRRHRGLLHLGDPPRNPDVGRAQRIDWRPGAPLVLPDGTRLDAHGGLGLGLAADRLADAATAVVFRRGGERCRPRGSAHSRTLKNLLREHGVPPWLRPRIPLVEVDGRIAAVPGVCVCEGFAAAPGERGWELRWSEWGGR